MLKKPHHVHLRDGVQTLDLNVHSHRNRRACKKMETDGGRGAAVIFSIAVFIPRKHDTGWECRHHHRERLELQGISFSAKTWSQTNTLLYWDSALKLFFCLSCTKCLPTAGKQASRSCKTWWVLTRRCFPHPGDSKQISFSQYTCAFAATDCRVIKTEEWKKKILIAPLSKSLHA